MNQALYLELERTMLQINRQIETAYKQAEEDRYEADVYAMRDRQGGFVLAPLLVAKAQCLLGMAMLKAGKT